MSFDPVGSWHQQVAPTHSPLYHETKWTCVSTGDRISVMRFDSGEEAKAYADKTGDTLLPPTAWPR